MDKISIIYITVVLVFVICGIVNIAMNIFKFRKKHVDDFLKQREQRRQQLKKQ